jgi:predicted glycosyltransferase
VPALLGLDVRRPIAVMRPPATLSLYHRGIRNTLFDEALSYLLDGGAQVVVLPRSGDQADMYTRKRGVIVPEVPVDGPSLLYAADLVVSAGGSMNREAAVMGVPTWTVFAGLEGAVDRSLIESGRMGRLERPEQLVIRKRIPAAQAFEPLADWATEEILAR